jgi:hypothetical protein
VHWSSWTIKVPENDNAYKSGTHAGSYNWWQMACFCSSRCTDADLCSNSPASCLVLFDSVWCCVLIVFLKNFEFFSFKLIFLKGFCTWFFFKKRHCLYIYKYFFFASTLLAIDVQKIKIILSGLLWISFGGSSGWFRVVRRWLLVAFLMVVGGYFGCER